jgi:RimJ/RimL family protein N-acetyltransferase
MFRFETSRLIVKPHTPANAEKMHNWENDPELVYPNDDDSDDFREASFEDVRRYVEQISRPYRGGENFHFAIHAKGDDAFIGYGTVALIDRQHRRCRLGITLGEKSVWGRGYAREALEPVIDYCFNDLDLNRIGVEIYCFNERSIRLFESLGFQREGLIRQSVWKGGRPLDDCLYGLLRADWEKIRGKKIR